MSGATGHRTTCPYCGVGCGVRAGVSPDGIAIDGVSGDESHPANLGRLCVKGAALHETLGTEGRLLSAEIGGEAVPLDAALQHVAESFLRIRDDYGPESIAFYLSGQLLTEDYYVANKLMKGFLGSANVDTNSRLCMSSAVAAYKRAFGEDVVPCDYRDLEVCDLLVLVGSNAAWTHPVLYQRMARAKQRRPEMKVVVIDPRRTATCDLADIHLASRPGSDGFIFNGLLNYLVTRGAAKREWIAAHTEGFDAALASVAQCSLQHVAMQTGIAAGELEQFYALFAATEKTVSFYSQGINQSSSGTDKCNAIINCHLATGRIGAVGRGPFSITGQPNAMGGREVGGLANQLAAHMGFDPESIERVRQFWSAPAMARAPGLSAVELFDAIGKGTVRAVWIMATNPAVSLPDADRARAALEKCELVVVSDCIRDTDTTACANVLLPAAAWAEKDGTVTNSERCISRQRQLLPTPGDARPDWWLITEVARRMGFGDAFAYAHPHEIFAEHAALSAFENSGERLFNLGVFAAMDRDAYDELGPVQWPLDRRPFADGRFSTPSGRARFTPVMAELPRQAVDAAHPFTLLTGRVRDQWHSMTRTGRTRRLSNHIDSPFVAFNPEDMQALGLVEGELCELTNDRGRVVLEALADPSLARATLFAPIHWSGRNASAARIGSLVAPVTDPVSGQPESKFVPVAARALKVSQWLTVVAREALNMSAVDYWVSKPAAEGVQYRIALLGDEAAPILRLLSTWAPVGERIELTGPQAGDYRALVVESGRLTLAVFAHGRREALPDETFVATLLGQTWGPLGWQLLSGCTSGGDESGRTICSCFEVGLVQIERAIASGADSVQALALALRCGTNCGSCIPELKQLLGQRAPRRARGDLEASA